MSHSRARVDVQAFVGFAGALDGTALRPREFARVLAVERRLTVLYTHWNNSAPSLLAVHTDRGNDNWLLKIEDPPLTSSSSGSGPAPSRVKLAAIDNGLSFPFKHPDSWRTCMWVRALRLLSVHSVGFRLRFCAQWEVDVVRPCQSTASVSRRKRIAKKILRILCCISRWVEPTCLLPRELLLVAHPRRAL